jgi:hypothetical protein
MGRSNQAGVVAAASARAGNCKAKSPKDAAVPQSAAVFRNERRVTGFGAGVGRIDIRHLNWEKQKVESRKRK